MRPGIRGFVVLWTVNLLALALMGCGSAMRRPPETLEQLCARQPSAPACRYMEVP